MRHVSRAELKRELHRKYRQACHLFFSKAKMHRMRTKDGGGKVKNNSQYFTVPPSTILVQKTGLELVGKRYTTDQRRQMRHGVWSWTS